MLEVVVPIYNAADDLRACLQALADTLTDDVPVLLIDDASPDPAIGDILDSACRHHPHWRQHRLPENGGFVKTANAGLRATKGDAVLLNSDTLPTPGWHQALSRCLASSEAIATATPWSNNGEIVSIPEFCRANPMPDAPNRIGRALQTLFAEERPVSYPEMPTAVGFCMAISRRVLDEIGLFDAQQFGLGYGEENDFSQRAIAAGYRNVLCPDAYVAHRGNASFGPRGLQPSTGSMQRLLAKHPQYLEDVQAFIQADPFSSLRQRVVDGLRQHDIELG